ncbi:MAG: CHAT domain-containing protein [Chloroflexaceae bacterium]|nr:CHAT domain-containing protein [Chloroflexaceae bacterium]
MSLIIIREASDNPEGTNATISFDNGPDYPITLINPFTDNDEAHLSNYSVNCLQHPFAYQHGDEELFDNLRRYGELLFEHVFADMQVYAHYQELIATQLDELHIEIAGTAQFHCLRWELLKDPHHATPLALDIPIVRRKLNPQWVGSSLIPSPTINVLIVTARPFTNSAAAYRTIARTLIEQLPMPSVPVQCDILRPGTYPAFVEHLEAIHNHHGSRYYQCVHFDIPYESLTYEELDAHNASQSGHHRYILYNRLYRDPIQPFEGHKNFFLMESDRHNTADLVDVLEMADLIVSNQIPIVVLHTHQTEPRQHEQESHICYELLDTGIPVVLATGDTTSTSTTQLVFRTFYHHLATGTTVSHAARQIRTRTCPQQRRIGFFNQAVQREDWFQIKLFQNQDRRLEMRECTPTNSKHLTNGIPYAHRFPNQRIPLSDANWIPSRLKNSCLLAISCSFGESVDLAKRR